uniref:Uncharacterized protein n=1 Tax=Arundo donax TaxID=35708 RepID=A0A0A9H0T7_ARUDO
MSVMLMLNGRATRLSNSTKALEGNHLINRHIKKHRPDG